MARRKEKLDSLDAERVEETIRTPGWQLIGERIAVELQRHRLALENPQTEAETATLRGRIAGLKTALEVPGILMREGKENPTE